MSTAHASCVTVGGRGVLIRGQSGAGKSRLAHILLLRGPLYGLDTRLVADDRVTLSVEASELRASAPPPLQGLLEVRGLGLITLPFVPRSRVDLVLDLLPALDVPRLPEKEQTSISLMGVTLPRAFALTPESGLDVLLTINGQSGSVLDPDTALASVRFDGKTECP